MTSLATLKEMRRMLVCYGFPTPAIDEEIALLTAVGDPFLSPAEVAEVRAVLLAKGYAHPMVSMGIAKVPEAAALLAIDLASGACTRVIEFDEVVDVCAECSSLSHATEEHWQMIYDDDNDDNNVIDPLGVLDVKALDAALALFPRVEMPDVDHDDLNEGDDTPQAYAQGLNDARQNDADAEELEERTRR